jgi:CBS domain-containing protein
MLIRDILSLKGGAVHTIEPWRPLADAVRLMVELDIGSLVVIENGCMAGMLTFREVLQAVDAAPDALKQTRAEDVMVREPMCGHPGDTLDELREAMTRHHVRYLPVTDGERLLGVLSFHDVAKAVIRETTLENRLLKRYIESQGGEGG